MRDWRVHFEPESLVLEAYPIVRKGRAKRLAAEELGEVCVGWWPPAVRTREGEFLFVPAPQVRELADFADRRGLPFVWREDVWSWILEEFLDTEFPPESQEGTLRLLERNGVSREETRAMRERVGGRMLRMTALTWEWQHYGLFDVLRALQPFSFGAFTRFYAEAMRLADRGGTRPATREELLRFFPPEPATPR